MVRERFTHTCRNDGININIMGQSIVQPYDIVYEDNYVNGLMIVVPGQGGYLLNRGWYTSTLLVYVFVIGKCMYLCYISFLLKYI